MGCTEGFVRLLVFAVNLVFVLAGLALIIVGVIYQLDINKYTEGIPEEYQNVGLASALTIAIGSIIFLIAFFGCCGAVRESTCLLTTYAVILLVIFLLQVAIGVFAFLEIKDEDNFKEKVEQSVTTLFNEYPTNNESMKIVDLIQSEFKCCGTNGPSYWGKSIPKSCIEDKEVFEEGCTKVFFNFLKNSVKVIGITLLALSATEVLSAIFSLCLSNSIKNRERRFRY